MTRFMFRKLISCILFLALSQEGANINKSLTTLGKVISALAEVVCIVSAYIVQNKIKNILCGINLLIYCLLHF